MWKSLRACLIALLVGGHGWYPHECCSGLDCAEVTQFSHPIGEQLEALIVPGTPTPPMIGDIGPLAVTTKYGTVVVPDKFPRRRSEDSNWHACIRIVMKNNVVLLRRLLCLFEPDPTL
jgi:hypothetical protein